MSDSVREALEIVEKELRRDIASGGSQVVRAWQTIKAALSANGGEPAGWAIEREGDSTFPRFYFDKAHAESMVREVELLPHATMRPVYTHPAQPSVAVPDGWKLVPIEPTDEMIGAGADASNAFRVDILRSYEAMLSVVPAPDQHPDDAAVDRFATAMKCKLAKARDKGRGGWDDPAHCSVEFLADLLLGHIGKGNPGNFEDIANLAMMLHQRGADPSVLLKVDHIADAGKVVQGEPIGYLTNQAIARLKSDERLNGEHLYAFKPDDMSKFQAVYLSSVAALPAESLNELDCEDQKGMERIVEAVAHIGIDFGYGEYELEQCHIDRAREIKESLDRLRASQQEGNTAGDDGEGV